ncbi:MAG: branched-chain amino acid ABC transporter substrate-binding protein [Anaerolineaceae bacterium]|nr:branched-chain amino acid ABC transporter substrate-binding protein [Anaerolineaceae bacterium]MDE0329801.1 branched-chain amino acid ABC transporter substrate-binding protein [Anaerolineaceae bacterium]
MRRLSLSIFLLLLSLFIAIGPGLAEGQVCEDEIACVSIGPDEPVTIAWMLVTTGANSFFGEDSLGGIEIALEQRGGTLLGREIELIGEDSQCTPEGGQLAAQRLVANDSVLAIIGPNCSSAAEAAIPVTSRAGYVLVTPTAVSSTLTSADRATGGTWMPGFFRTIHTNALQGRVAGCFAREILDAQTLATIHDGSTFAHDLQDAMAGAFVELGGEVVYQGAVNVGDTDMTALLTEIASFSPDILFFPIFQPEGDFLVAQAQYVAGLDNTILMGSDNLLTPGFVEATGEAALDVILFGPNLAGEAYSNLLEKWRQRYGTEPPGGFHAHAYDTTNLLLDAIESVAQVGEDGVVLIGRQALRDAMSATRDFKGITGSLTCSATGDCATGEAIGIFRIGEPEVFDEHWPPAVIWNPSTGQPESNPLSVPGAQCP